jgi:hypothetical protein
MPLYTPTVSGDAYTVISGTTQTISKTTNYLANNAAQVVFSLPASSVVGDYFSVVGKGAGGWKIAQLASQQIHMGASNTTIGTGGSLSSNSIRDAVRLVCTVANLEWNVIFNVGSTVVV